MNQFLLLKRVWVILRRSGNILFAYFDSIVDSSDQRLQFVNLFKMFSSTDFSNVFYRLGGFIARIASSPMLYLQPGSPGGDVDCFIFCSCLTVSLVERTLGLWFCVPPRFLISEQLWRIFDKNSRSFFCCIFLTMNGFRGLHTFIFREGDIQGIDWLKYVHL